MEEENQTLRELLQTHRNEQSKQEQVIRETLVAEHEKQREQTINLWKNRLEYMENIHSDKVHCKIEIE